MKTVKIKKTGQRVYILEKVDTNHTYCIFHFDKVSKKGNLGVVQSVRNDNLVFSQEFAG